MHAYAPAAAASATRVVYCNSAVSAVSAMGRAAEHHNAAAAAVQSCVRDREVSCCRPRAASTSYRHQSAGNRKIMRARVELCFGQTEHLDTQVHLDSAYRYSQHPASCCFVRRMLYSPSSVLQLMLATACLLHIGLVHGLDEQAYPSGRGRDIQLPDLNEAPPRQSRSRQTDDAPAPYRPDYVPYRPDIECPAGQSYYGSYCKRGDVASRSRGWYTSCGPFANYDRSGTDWNLWRNRLRSRRPRIRTPHLCPEGYACRPWYQGTLQYRATNWAPESGVPAPKVQCLPWKEVNDYPRSEFEREKKRKDREDDEGEGGAEGNLKRPTPQSRMADAAAAAAGLIKPAWARGSSSAKPAGGGEASSGRDWWFGYTPRPPGAQESGEVVMPRP